MKQKALFSWSSGKDSAYALYEILQNNDYEVVALVTTMTENFKRVSMHGTREELLDMQAKSIDIPLIKIRIPDKCPNEIYEQKMEDVLMRYKGEGVLDTIFGDLFLEDIRSYREKNLAQLRMRGVFPIWQRETKELAHEMIRLGFKAIVTCVDLKQLPAEFSGREFNRDFLADLPKGIDPCGENGEFHTFVYDGPIFKAGIPIRVGQTVEREGFAFADVCAVEIAESDLFPSYKFSA